MTGREDNKKEQEDKITRRQDDKKNPNTLVDEATELKF